MCMTRKGQKTDTRLIWADIQIKNLNVRYKTSESDILKRI